jgi:hypothetical protein
MTDRPWFRARASGLGWTPITWEGWFVTLSGMVIVMAVNIILVALLLAQHG